MPHRTSQGGLPVATVLNNLLTQRLCPGTGLSPEVVWAALEKIVADLAPRVRGLAKASPTKPRTISLGERAKESAPKP